MPKKINQADFDNLMKSCNDDLKKSHASYKKGDIGPESLRAIEGKYCAVPRDIVLDHGGSFRVWMVDVKKLLEKNGYAPNLSRLTITFYSCINYDLTKVDISYSSFDGDAAAMKWSPIVNCSNKQKLLSGQKVTEKQRKRITKINFLKSPTVPKCVKTLLRSVKKSPGGSQTGLDKFFKKQARPFDCFSDGSDSNFVGENVDPNIHNESLITLSMPEISSHNNGGSSPAYSDSNLSSLLSCTSDSDDSVDSYASSQNSLNNKRSWCDFFGNPNSSSKRQRPFDCFNEMNNSNNMSCHR